MTEIKRLFDCLDYQATQYPQEVTLASKVDGVWKKYSSQDTVEESYQIAAGLLALGIAPQDKVAIVSTNRPEWALVDLGMSRIGAINVPMYPNSLADDYRFILKDASVKAIFVGDQEVYDKVKAGSKGLPCEKMVYTFDQIDGAIHWTTMKKQVDSETKGKIDAISATIKPEMLATLIYTSGTTGNPKGVMLSHNNIISNATAVGNVFPFVNENYKILSFLPLCHVFERTGLYLYLYKGVSIYFAESIETISENLKEVQPHFFATVPRLLEKIYDKILTKGYTLTGIKRSLFFWSLKLATQYKIDGNNGFFYKLKMGIARKLIFSKWQEALGGNVQFIVSGAAALQPRLVTLFWAAEIKVLQAYGMTESSPGVSFTRPNPEEVRIEAVGRSLQDIEIRIAEDGEILVKGPNVMMGYYNRPDLTEKTINKEGWLHTGDIGELVEGKYLKITDRKKEMFKTSGGKYIAPQIIENKFKESMLIEQAMVVGESQKFPAALIVPSLENLHEWARLHGIVVVDDASLLEMPEVVEKYQTEIEKHNQSFAQYEKVKKFKLLSEPWQIESGELTPTLKLKRKIIKEKHQKEIDAFYQS